MNQITIDAQIYAIGRLGTGGKKVHWISTRRGYPLCGSGQGNAQHRRRGAVLFDEPVTCKLCARLGQLAIDFQREAEIAYNSEETE